MASEIVECLIADDEEPSPNYRPNLLNRLDSVSDNGLIFNSVYLPQEIVTLILTYLDTKNLIQASLVCRKWFNIVRSNTLWYAKLKRHCKRKPKKVPWYVYFAYFHHRLFDRNLIKNGNGEKKFKHWVITRNGGDRFRVEKIPAGADPLPTEVEDFNGRTSCFATSYRPCVKLQRIKLAPLCRYILDVHKPDIYASEWVAGRFDCGCKYTLTCSLYGRDEDEDRELATDTKSVQIAQWEGKEWSKVDMVLRDYPDGVKDIIFQHQGRDTQFWAGHYGPKMAGGLVTILFNTLKEVADDEESD